jgi:hypothetical protein
MQRRDTYIMGADDGASPKAHVNVITIIHSIANSAITNTFFTSFKLLQQSEVPWNCIEAHTFKHGSSN